MKLSYIHKAILWLVCFSMHSAWAWSPIEINSSGVILESPLQLPPEENPNENAAKAALSNAKAAPVYANCNFNNFGSESGTTLVNHVKSVNPSCLYDLFNVSTVSSSALSHANMTTIINAARTAAASYQGTNAEGMEQLILFIRAGYFQTGNNTLPAYTSSHQSLIRAFITGFTANTHFYNNTTEEHGESLYEFMTMFSNVKELAAGLPVAKRVIDNFNQTRAAGSEQSAAVNASLNVLFYGFSDDAYKQAVANNTSIVESLFLLLRDKKWIIGTNREYLYNNAAGELGRFLGIAATKALTKARIKSIMPGFTLYSPPWLKIAAQIDFYTASECAEYANVCNYKPAAIASLFPVEHTCSATLKMKAQAITSAQRAESCNLLATEEAYFHNRLNTGNTPIAGDLNEDLLMVIFKSPTDYANYGNPLFGIATNNGGMYIEGNPTNASNQATFYAYIATTTNFQIWNLEHEYVHYLDGRFNMAGNFSAPTVKVVWWSEGLAEYISKKDTNQLAINTITDGSTYTLQQVLDTTYDGFVVDRIYQWGYLAVRFMFEKHPGDVTNYLTAARAGNWSTIQTYYNQWASSYSNEFTQWTQALANSGGSSSGGSSSGGSSSGGSSSGGTITNACSTEAAHTASSVAMEDVICVKTGTSSGSIAYHYVNVPAGTSSITIKTAHGTGNGSLYYNASTWATATANTQSSTNSGNTESITVTNPASGNRFFSVVGQQSGMSLLVTTSTGGSSSGGSSSGGSSSGGSSSGGSSSGGSSSGGSSSGGSSSGGSSSGGSSSGGTITNACSTEAAHTASSVVMEDVICVKTGTSSGSIAYHYVNVPAGTSSITIKTAYGTGNGSLYYNANTWATSTANTQSSTNSGNTESITVTNPASGNRFFSVVGQQSGMSLLVTTSTNGSGGSSSGGSSSGGSSSGGSSSGGSSSGGSSSGGSSSGGSSSGGSSSGGSSSGGNALNNGQTVTGLAATTGNDVSNYYIDVPTGATNLVISISAGSGATGDADLYVKKGIVPTDSSYDCRPYIGGNAETCGGNGTALTTSAGRFYIRLKPYSSFTNVNLVASYTAAN